MTRTASAWEPPRPSLIPRAPRKTASSASFGLGSCPDSTKAAASGISTCGLSGSLFSSEDSDEDEDEPSPDDSDEDASEEGCDRFAGSVSD